MNHILPSGWEQGAGLCPCCGFTTHSGAQGAPWEGAKALQGSGAGDGEVILPKIITFHAFFHMEMQNFSDW